MAPCRADQALAIAVTFGKAGYLNVYQLRHVMIWVRNMKHGPLRGLFGVAARSGRQIGRGRRRHAFSHGAYVPISYLSTRQITALTPSIFGTLSATQISSLSGAQVGAISATGIAALGATQVGALSATQVHGLSA